MSAERVTRDVHRALQDITRSAIRHPEGAAGLRNFVATTSATILERPGIDTDVRLVVYCAHLLAVDDAAVEAWARAT